MPIPLHVAFHDIEPNPELEQFAQHWAIKLEHFYPWVERCDVVIEPHDHDEHMYVRVTVAVPGPEVVVSREQVQEGGQLDAFVAIRDAFRAARTQLTDHFVRSRLASP